MKSLYLVLLPLFLSSFASCQQKQADKESATQEVKNIHQDLSVETFLSKLKNDDNAVLIDVRTPEETAEGMIPGAKEVDFRASNFSQQISELDKDKAYYLYCRSGARSANAMNMMKEMGFPEVYNLVGGYNAYQSAKK